ncbi:MAG: MFS transporter [Clostridiales bacterium]|nr:MFS transporter [Clostridiales bacterium]MDY4655497.1 MFS transporter [Eubacteriales bacterium]
MEEKDLAQAVPAKQQIPENERVPLKEKIFYGMGALMDGGGVALMSCVMLNYMTDHLKIYAASASTVMMISKIWDAITDPVMGHITDNTRSKYGRRKPYMFVGGFLLIIALLLLFAPIREWGITSQAGMVAYVLIFYMVWNTCSTITQVPYTSMASDISPSFEERNRANTVKLVFSAVAAGLAYVVPLLLLGQLNEGKMTSYVFWIIMVAVFGTLFGGGLICTGLFTKERITETGPKKKFDIKEFLKGYIKPFKNKSYRWHIIMYVSAFTCMDMLSALAAYYATHVWKGVVLDLGFMQMQFGSMFIVAPLMVAAVCAFPLVRVLIDKKGKAFAFRVGLPFYIIGGILLAVLDPQWCPPIIIPIVSFIMGLGFGGAQMVPWMVFPDTLDVVELATGERPTGNYSGIMTLVRKVSGALGVGVIGWVLSGVGYDQYINVFKAYQDINKVNGTSSAFDAITSLQIGDAIRNHAVAISEHLTQMNSADPSTKTMTAAEVTAAADNVAKVLLTIRLLMGIAIAILISVALFASFQYKVTSKKLKRVKYYLDHMHNGTLDELTDEERAEMEKLQTELCFKVTTQPVASAVSASDETEFAEFTEEIVENETDDENK